MARATPIRGPGRGRGPLGVAFQADPRSSGRSCRPRSGGGIWVSCQVAGILGGGVVPAVELRTHRDIPEGRPGGGGALRADGGAGHGALGVQEGGQLATVMRIWRRRSWRSLRGASGSLPDCSVRTAQTGGDACRCPLGCSPSHGSDSAAGPGSRADSRRSWPRVHGIRPSPAVTVQNSVGVQGFYELERGRVRADRVGGHRHRGRRGQDRDVASAPIIEAVAGAASASPCQPVVDPVAASQARRPAAAARRGDRPAGTAGPAGPP